MTVSVILAAGRVFDLMLGMFRERCLMLDGSAWCSTSVTFAARSFERLDRVQLRVPLFMPLAVSLPVGTQTRLRAE